MNAIDRPGMQTAPATRTGVPPRIFYLDPLLAPDLAVVLDQAKVQGFNTVLIPPPWQPGGDGHRFAPASLERMHPALSPSFLDDFVRACRGRGLRPMLDVPLATLAANFHGATAGFTESAAGSALDPRRTQTGARQALPGADLGPFWAAHAARWAGLGVTGLRLLGLNDVDAAAVIAAIRLAAPALTLIAWTPGVPPGRLAALRGVDFTVSSLPWWDGRATWLWEEMDRLRAIAPVLSCPEIPFDRRVAARVSGAAAIPAALRLAATLAATLGDGWMVPMGFAEGARRRLEPAGSSYAVGDQHADIGAEITALNTMLMAAPAAKGEQPLSGPGSPVLAVLRTDAADPRFAQHAWLHVINVAPRRAVSIDPATLISRIDGVLTPFQMRGGDKALLVPGEMLTLKAGESQVFTAQRRRFGPPPPLQQAGLEPFTNGPRVAIEAPTPCIDNGTMPVKRLVGDVVPVSADVICDGHDVMAVVMRWRGPGQPDWTEVRMRPLGNDRFGADLPLSRLGGYHYTIEAWRDVFATYRYELAKKVEAGLNVALELREGVILIERTAERVAALQPVAEALKAAAPAEQQAMLLSAEMAAQMMAADDRPRAATSQPRIIRIDAERAGAAFAAWYEVFPRSMSDDPVRHGTFADVERHLPRVKAMGFDVLYFPPIHPIGRVNRKGANNTLTPSATDPGSPYAIGSAEGGHEALHPELGSFEDFAHLIQAAAGHGLEIAIDFAIQCAPDHPWLRDHKEWFEWRPDGSIRYAENPPKKYQDIVNVDFYAAGAIPSLWEALANSVLFWCKHGVRLFRVDNPHTKPFPFWQWMIAQVRNRYPDAVFLAEAFTRPKVMYRLAKVGFSQSYTYFTWRETKAAMEEYLTELSAPGPRDFFRPHFFVNTPDINPVYLQGAPRSAYVIRAALAAMLSGLWGVYNGFELCEGTPVPGREEYMDSEKYQIRAWDWDRPGNIVAEITALNRIRKLNPALHSHLDPVFLPAGNGAVTVFEKASAGRANVVVTAISFDPNQPQETGFEFPFWNWGVTEQTAFDVENLVTGERLTWRGKSQFVRLTPEAPYAVWLVRPAV